MDDIKVATEYSPSFIPSPLRIFLPISIAAAIIRARYRDDRLRVCLRNIMIDQNACLITLCLTISNPSSVGPNEGYCCRYQAQEWNLHPAAIMVLITALYACISF
jgi:hypothetical protein